METASRLSGLSALVEEAQGAIPESVTVVDPTQSLQIVLRADGVVDDFQILMRWRERIPPKRLGAAISDLLAQARRELYADCEEALEEGAARLGSAQSSKEFNVLTDPVAQQIRDNAQELLERSKGMAVPYAQALSEADDYVERALQAAFQACSSGLEEEEEEAEEVHDAPVRCVRRGGAISSVLIDGNWAASTPTPSLRAEIMATILADVDDGQDGELFAELAEEGDRVLGQLIGSIERLTQK